MYLAGQIFRAYVYAPAGSPFCPPNLVNGCYNTGRIDMGALKGQACLSPDPMQFASLQDVQAYAAARGETPRAFASAEEVTVFCSQAGVDQTPQPAVTPTPSYQPSTTTSSGARLVSTGAPAPSAPQPIIVSVPGAPVRTEMEAPDVAPSEDNTGLLIAAILGAAFLFSRR